MIILATNEGVMVANENDGWEISARKFVEKAFTAVAAQADIILAGTTAGIFRSEDAGQTWQEANAGLAYPHIRWLAFHPDTPGCAFAGSEPASIHISEDSGKTWRECTEVAQLRDRFRWSLPYSPEAGCVRGFAGRGSRVYAAVEVGGVLRSDDGGQSWRLAEGSSGQPNFNRPTEPMIHADVHSIYVHPSSTELVYAPTGGGFYRSSDGGKTWRLHYDCYVRAAWIDPQDSDHILLGPADGVDRGGRIEESRDGGETWAMSSDGLPVPWPRHMVERFEQTGEYMIAVLSNGEVLSRPIQGGTWKKILEDSAEVNAVTSVT